MYSIMHVIYGVPLTEACSEIIDKFELDETTDDWFEGEVDGNSMTCGFITHYTGGGPYHVGYCGVELWSANCISAIRLHDRPLEATDAQRELAEKRVAELHAKFQEALKDYPIGVYIVFSTS